MELERDGESESKRERGRGREKATESERERDLRRRPRWRAERAHCRGDRAAGIHFRNAEVGDLARALAHEDVEALEVPVRHLPPPALLVSTPLIGHLFPSIDQEKVARKEC